MGAFTFIPEWVIQDLIIILAGLSVGAFILKHEEKPGRILLEFLAFCFLYASVYENFATLMGWYGYGRSILMIGNVPLTVPIIEYIVVYSCLRLAESMKLPAWAKPLFAGFNAMLFDFSLDPISVKLVRDTMEGRIGRWTWYPAPADAQILGEPVYNFTGWVLLAGYAAAFILLGRCWWDKSGKKDSVALAYPILGMIAALLVMISPLSRFLLWLAPFSAKGGMGEWIMLGIHGLATPIILACAWKGKMIRPLSLCGDWPVWLGLGGFHLMDILMCLTFRQWRVLPLVGCASALQWALLLWIWFRGRRLAKKVD